MTGPIENDDQLDHNWNRHSMQYELTEDVPLPLLPACKSDWLVTSSLAKLHALDTGPESLEMPGKIMVWTWEVHKIVIDNPAS